jgi:glycosyltransferase involved in cell wall biosynthesis
MITAVATGARSPFVVVVVPSFRAAATIRAVIEAIGPEVGRIYVVDDGCPDGTGDHVRRGAPDPRVVVLHNPRNLGVGGAMKLGYRTAMADGADIVVKVDADGQMDPRHISRLIRPLLLDKADYAKGDRFAPAALMPEGSAKGRMGGMPPSRLLANRVFTRVHRIATGYWQVSDPANGYTAIRRSALERLGIEELSDCFFFETDMLFRLNLINAAVADVPLPARYPGTQSNLSLRRIAPRFGRLLIHRTVQRLKRRYFSGSLNLVAAALLAGLGLVAVAVALAIKTWAELWPADSLAASPGWRWLALLAGLLCLAAAVVLDAWRSVRRPLWRREQRS